MNVSWLPEQDQSDPAKSPPYTEEIASYVADTAGILFPRAEDGLPSELHGTLGEGGLVPLVHWLEGLEASGHLRLRQADWNGELAFENGQLIAASADSTLGPVALEMIVLALADAQFVFTPGVASPTSATPSSLALAAELERLATLYQDSPLLRPELVPRLIERLDDQHDSVLLDGSCLGTLLLVNGARSVAEIATELGLRRATLDLARLWQSGLILFAAPLNGPGGPEPELAIGSPTGPEGVLVEPAIVPEQRADATSPFALPWRRHRSKKVIVAVLGVSAALVAALALGLERVSPAPTPMAEPAAATPLVETAALAAPTVATTPTLAASAEPPNNTLLHEQFTGRPVGWPSDSSGVARLTDTGYEVLVRSPDNFVAIGAPALRAQRDVLLTARFHKAGGPPGGGYGLIVRDQGPGPRDGLNQAGNFYLLEVRDTGEVGAWRHVGQQWLDLLPWTASSAVQRGAARNELQASAIGNQLRFLVNGVEVVNGPDADPAAGGVGIFVGGDSNDVVLERFAAQTPD